ncbi:unnamed protein product, partial [Dicrocoelium dendriticum]
MRSQAADACRSLNSANLLSRPWAFVYMHESFSETKSMLDWMDEANEFTPTIKGSATNRFLDGLHTLVKYLIYKQVSDAPNPGVCSCS